MSDSQDTIFSGWKEGDAFIVAPSDDASRCFAASHAWPHFGRDILGRVEKRVWVHVSGVHTVPGLLIIVGGDHTSTPCVVTGDTLNVCARKVTQ
jgi:hypothetical protein